MTTDYLAIKATKMPAQNH